MDTISPTKYYSSDIIPPGYQSVYGVWKIYQTSGGLAGQGYTPDFDFLVIKPYGIFGIIKNDSVIAYGKLTRLTDNTMSPVLRLYCSFDFDKTAKIELAADPEKYFFLTGSDTLDLMAPCCDRFNTRLVRQKTNLDGLGKTGLFEGNIDIGPICPVETVPPQPGCQPTAQTYAAWQLAVWNAAGTNVITNIQPQSDGSFSLPLPEGDYQLNFASSDTHSFGGTKFPVKLTISGNETYHLDISIDTGIR